MKNKIIITTTLLIIGVAVSCKDSFLEQKPFGAVTSETLSATLTGADALLIASYSAMDGFAGWGNGGPWGSAASNWTYGSIAGGDAYKGSEANDQPDITPIERHETTASNPYIEAKWNTYYDGISRANQAIRAYKSLKTGSAATIAIRLGEARFLRGYYHYELKRVFGNVPYIDDAVTEFRIPNDKDIWPQIQADLSAAATAIPATQSDAGRATKGAALGILGLSYLWQGNYAEGKKQFDAIIALGRYKLNDKYQDNFDPAVQNSAEGVIEVQQAVNVGTDDHSNQGDILNFPYGAGPGGCCGFFQPSQNLVNAFRVDANGLPLIATYNDKDIAFDTPTTTDKFVVDTNPIDSRVDWTAGRKNIPYLDWGLHNGVVWQRDPGYAGPYSPKKNVYYKAQEGTLTSASGWTKGYNTNNVKILRYSDVLLLAAECEVEVGDLNRARTLVNQVRARAANSVSMVKKYVSDADPTKGFTNVNAANYKVGTYSTPWTDKTAAREAVRFERRIELGMEGHRRFDLVRWGVAETVLNKYLSEETKKRTYLTGATFKKGKSEYEPIPYNAIVRSSLDGVPTLKQNPGY